MIIFGEKKALTLIAVLTLCVFFSAFFLHAFIPHEHPHESTSANVLTALHVNVSDKLALPIGALVAIVFLFSPRLVSHLERARIYIRRAEWLLVIPQFYLHRSLARGILHTKIY
jgi:type II secretory pathway component PulF